MLMLSCPYHTMYHFYEMKGDVGMSRHEKEGEQEDKTESHSQPHLLYEMNGDVDRDVMALKRKGTRKCIHQVIHTSL